MLKRVMSRNGRAIVRNISIIIIMRVNFNQPSVVTQAIFSASFSGCLSKPDEKMKNELKLIEITMTNER
jgi:hypothetical protein